MTRRINLAGPFLWAWGFWHLCWLAGFGLIPAAGPEFALAWFRLLYGAFLPLELTGAWLNARHPDGRARTLSEFRQWVAARGAPDRPGLADDWFSWRGLAGTTGMIDAAVMGTVVGAGAVDWLGLLLGPELGAPAGVVLGAMWALALALYLVPHFGWSHLFR